MGFCADILRHPRRVWLRRALFQVHLWIGVLFSFYLVLISLSGAILVFRSELTRTTFPKTLSSFDPRHTASPSAVLANFEQRFPHASVNYLTLPSAALPAFQFDAKDAAGRPLHALADPESGVVLPQPRTWLDIAYDLHVYLLLGKARGIQYNGIGAVALVLLAVSGLAIWWRGLAAWRRSLRISLRHNWRRINFDLHSALGFWTLAIVTWWALSGIYFAWYRPFARAVNAISALRGMAAPALPPVVQTSELTAPSLETLLSAAQAASPNGHLYRLSNPALVPGTPVYAYMDLRAPGDYSHRDIVTLDPSTARVLTIWHYGENYSLGDWFLWAMLPLHSGSLWGLGVKVVWSLAGVSLAVLTVSGLLMYWNRYLRHRWSLLRR